MLLRGARWPALLSLSGAGAVTGAAAVAMGAGPALVVLQLALVLLGGAAACALDEPAAAVVAACPVRRSRLVLVRAAVAGVALAAGVAVVLAWWARSGVDRLLLLELAGCWALGFSLAVLACTRIDEPAEAVAPGVVLLLLSVLLVGPVGRRLVLFPAGDLAARGVRTWWAVLASCAIAVAAVVPDHRWRPRR